MNGYRWKYCLDDPFFFPIVESGAREKSNMLETQAYLTKSENKRLLLSSSRNIPLPTSLARDL